MEQPPPVPVTQPRCQNLAHREGMRLAGWVGEGEVTRWSLEDLTEFLEGAMDRYPDAYAVLVRRHGVYVWGESVHKAKTQCERYVLYTFVCWRQIGCRPRCLLTWCGAAV